MGTPLPDAVARRVRFEARRKVLHIVTAIVAVPVVLIVPYWLALILAVVGLGIVTLTWGIERRMFPPELKGPLHEPLAHVLHTTRRPGEDFPWSPVLYTVALVLVTTAHQFLSLSWAVAFAAYAILGIGDAASALVGVAYGKRKLPWNAKKSWEGTSAGAAAGFMAGAVLGAVPFVLAAALIPPLFVVVVLVGAIVGALAESLPRVEDNFVVPLASTAAMWLVAAALRVPLP